jgi:hypothetical protein
MVRIVCGQVKKVHCAGRPAGFQNIRDRFVAWWQERTHEAARAEAGRHGDGIGRATGFGFGPELGRSI